jgi:DNA-binding GntR family transcriptional regulator
MLELTEKLRVATNRFYYLNGAGGGRHLDKCRHRQRAILRAAKAGDVAGAVAQLDLHLAEAAEEVARDAERHQLSA